VQRAQSIGQVTTHSADETEALGAALGRQLLGGEVIGLSGDLGAGKTCFVRGVASGLGVPSEYPVASPTFTLLNEYPGRLTLFHADLYRLNRIDDLVEIGLIDHYGGNGVCIVEWFDRFPEAIPREHLAICFNAKSDTSRMLSLTASGQRYESLARAMLQDR
jgi:tRNA threonylcarbamoyladenosine biosynthesis protein TsaE